jgi:hypothetical protein
LVIGVDIGATDNPDAAKEKPISGTSALVG